jgi:hypothetical protein
MKDWKQFNFRNFLVPAIFYIVGIIMGIMFSRNSNTKKDYPIEVRCYWNTNGYQSYPTMDADSVKGDIIWKDGISIVNKNIINVSFK